MSRFRSFLIARARAEGRGVRSTAVRHRALRPNAHLLLMWQLGGEPFSVSAIRWLPINDVERRSTFIMGDPRNREGFLTALCDFAKVFNGWFLHEPRQLVVPNRPTVALLERLSQRLRSLPENAVAAEIREPLLVLGRILHLITTESHRPGQGLLVVLTDLIASHWATELSDVEASNLSALDAAIDPGSNSVAEAVLVAEQLAIGPSPSRTEDEPVIAILAELARGRREGDLSRSEACRLALHKHYSDLFEPAESLCMRCIRRERTFMAAEHVGERWQADEVPLWREGGPVSKTTTARYYDGAAPDLIARRVQQWEHAEQRVGAAELTEDWMRRAQQVLEGRAIVGRVVSCSTQKPMQLEVETDTLPYLPEGETLFVCSRKSPLELKVVATRGRNISFSGSPFATSLMREQFLRDYPSGADIFLTEFNGRPRDFGGPVQRDLPWTHSNIEPPEEKEPAPEPIDRVEDAEVDPLDAADASEVRDDGTEGVS